MLSILSAYFRTGRVRTAALLYFLLAGVLTRVPLFNYLGYEFSAIMTIPAALLSGIVTLRSFAEHRSRPLTRRTWSLVAVDYLLVNAILLLIPLGVMALNGVVVKNCAWGTGILYYILLPYGSMVFATGLAMFIGTYFRVPIVFFLLVLFAIVGQIAFITVTQPQLFAYNFILGYFPGITYDETLTDIGRIVLYREFTILAAVLFFALSMIGLSSYRYGEEWREFIRRLASNRRRDAVLWSVVAVCGCVLAAGHVMRDRLGFEYSEEEIQSALGRRSQSEHFVYHFRAEDFPPEKIGRLKIESELQYRRVADFLETTSGAGGKIDLYLYPDAEWKQRYIGTTNTNITKPWKREIHITVATYRTTFRHELVHALAAEFGVPLLHASLYMGWNEGLAVAADWNEGMYTAHEYAAGLLRTGILSDPEDLFTLTGFATHPGPSAYIVAGSFVRYLTERFGIERVKVAFPAGNFVHAFGETRDQLLAEWQAYLRQPEHAVVPAGTIRSLFSSPSIFYKTCVRTVASQLQEGNAALRQRDFRTAYSNYRQAYDNAATPAALRGMVASLNGLYLPDSARRLVSIDEQQRKSSGKSVAISPSVTLALIDASFLAGDRAGASSWCDTLILMNYSEPVTESAAIRKECVRSGLDTSLYHLVFSSGMPDSVRAISLRHYDVTNNNSIIRYLSAIIGEVGIGKDSALTVIAASTHSTSKEVRYAAAVRCAELSLSLGKTEEAKGWYWQALNDASTEALREQLQERMELCDELSVEIP